METDYQAQRQAMIASTIAARSPISPRVLQAMQRVPRHLFVRGVDRKKAYADQPLPIPAGQTISQPYIVALMSEYAEIKGANGEHAPDVVLEVGTGSGYQTAVLLELGARVFSVEYFPELAAFARANLAEAGYLTPLIELRVGDGYVGDPEHAPFDAIVVAAAVTCVPEPLLQQLKIGGRLLIPVGAAGKVQTLQRWTRQSAGVDKTAFRHEDLLDVRFVPFLRDPKEASS